VREIPILIQSGRPVKIRPSTLLASLPRNCVILLRREVPVGADSLRGPARPESLFERLEV